MSTAVFEFLTEICAPPVSRSGFLWSYGDSFGTRKNLILFKYVPALCEANVSGNTPRCAAIFVEQFYAIPVSW